MTSQVLEHRIPARASALLCSLALILFAPTAVFAQTAAEGLAEAQPELAALIDSAYVAQARMFEKIAAIDRSAAARDARNQFETSLRMRANMSMAQMMAMMKMDSGMQTAGPFDEWESEAAGEMMELLQTPHSRAEIAEAYRDSPIPDRAAEVIRLGRAFENRVYEILADNAISDKGRALDDAVSTYLAADPSVPVRPKPSSLLLDHPHAGAFADGYPKLSSLLWFTQWLQLATIEAMLLQEQDPYYWGSVDTVRERFQRKMLDSATADSPLPVELPMVPAIAPTLFTFKSDVAIILDNLNMFETVVADVLSYPNLRNKSAIVTSLVDQFTNHAEIFDPTIDYLVSALRGGIYNQGGPAIGQLSQSERNRSRMEMGMQHSMIMSAP